MKSYSVIVVSIVLAFFAAYTSAEDSLPIQDICEIKYKLHENLSSVLTNDVGLEILNELLQNMKIMCMDPKAHDTLVTLFDGVIDTMTNNNVSQTLGNIFYWARHFMKNPSFRLFWHENMKGINMCFDKIEVIKQITDTLFNQLTLLLNNPNFDSTFDEMIEKFARMLKTRRNLKQSTAIFTRPLSQIKRLNSKINRQ